MGGAEHHQADECQKAELKQVHTQVKFLKNWDINQHNIIQNPFTDNPPSIKKCLSECFLCAQHQAGIIKKSTATSNPALKKLKFLHEKTRLTHTTVRKLYKTVSSEALRVFNLATVTTLGFLLAQRGKNLPTMQETRVQPLGWETPLEKGMATQSSIFAWKIETEEPGVLHIVHGVAKSQTRLND